MALSTHSSTPTHPFRLPTTPALIAPSQTPHHSPSFCTAHSLPIPIPIAADVPGGAVANGHTLSTGLYSLDFSLGPTSFSNQFFGGAVLAMTRVEWVLGKVMDRVPV
jgi:hypothetical protein